MRCEHIIVLNLVDSNDDETVTDPDYMYQRIKTEKRCKNIHLINVYKNAKYKTDFDNWYNKKEKYNDRKLFALEVDLKNEDTRTIQINNKQFSLGIRSHTFPDVEYHGVGIYVLGHSGRSLWTISTFSLDVIAKIITNVLKISGITDVASVRKVSILACAAGVHKNRFESIKDKSSPFDDAKGEDVEQAFSLSALLSLIMWKGDKSLRPLVAAWKWLVYVNKVELIDFMGYSKLKKKKSKNGQQIIRNKKKGDEYRLLPKDIDRRDKKPVAFVTEAGDLFLLPYILYTDKPDSKLYWDFLKYDARNLNKNKIKRTINHKLGKEKSKKNRPEIDDLLYYCADNSESILATDIKGLNQDYKARFILVAKSYKYAKDGCKKTKDKIAIRTQEKSDIRKDIESDYDKISLDLKAKTKWYKIGKDQFQLKEIK